MSTVMEPAEREQANVVENHPIFHDWYVHGDFIIAKRRGGRPDEIEREEHCNACSTHRITRIWVDTWEVLRRRYKYRKGEIIVRVSKEQFRRDQFLATTTLDEKTKALLAKAA